MPTDQELLAGISTGRMSGFHKLYQRHSDTLYRFSLMVSGSVSVAEEATQETFVYMLEHPDRFDGARSSSALGWLYGIARNRVRGLLRAQQRLLPETTADAPGCSAERAFHLSAAARVTHSAILQLPVEQREVLVLCGLQQVEYAAAADILDVPVGTVRSRLSRARAALQAVLIEQTGFSAEELSHGT